MKTGFNQNGFYNDNENAGYCGTRTTPHAAIGNCFHTAFSGYGHTDDAIYGLAI